MKSRLGTFFGDAIAAVSHWVQSPTFYAQMGAIAAAVFVGIVLARLAKRSAMFKAPPPTSRVLAIRTAMHRVSAILVQLFVAIALAITLQIAIALEHPESLIRIAEGLALLFLIYTILSRFVTSSFFRILGQWVGIPVALLAVFGWLDEVTAFLDGINLSVGNIELSVFDLSRTFVSGTILFWLGRASNSAGKDAIRRQEQLDVGTREVFAKLFEIGVFVVIFLLLLQIMGISLTALTVFGGALGVGLGFGLQQITSNFISGIILLLDRSLSIGDFIELEEGGSGTLRELNMRFGVLETYDGKDIVVPNEQFITSKYTNWTHKDPQQRYSIEFQVAYGTDLDSLFVDLRDICNKHPQVISGEEVDLQFRPDAEISGFGDSGIDLLIEFWMAGVDDGPNRVGADLLLSIYHLFRDNDAYTFPFPQREIRILGDQ